MKSSSVLSATVVSFGDQYGFADTVDGTRIMIHMKQCKVTRSGWITDEGLDEMPEPGNKVVLILHQDYLQRPRAYKWGPKKGYEEAIASTTETLDWSPAENDNAILELAAGANGRNGNRRKRRRQAMCGVAS